MVVGSVTICEKLLFSNKFGLSGLNKLCSSASLVFQCLSGPKMHEKAFYSQEERKEGQN